jgi:hypothetical protein
LTQRPAIAAAMLVAAALFAAAGRAPRPDPLAR